MDTGKRKGISDGQTGLLLALPAIAVFCAIILYPFINSVGMSFTNKSLLSPSVAFVGLQNYIQLFTDTNFFGVLKNTLVFVLAATLLPFALGFVWAIILNMKFRGSELLRGITLVNWIIPGVAIGFLWMWIFHGEYGVFNGILKMTGLINENINWLGQTKTAMGVVVIARTWQMLPWYMAFLLGGLQGISGDQLEAVRMDGAGNIRSFMYIVLPEMKGIISLVLILGTIGNLQHFDLIWVMTEGGPARATTTLSIEVYRNAFKYYNMGFAAAVGTVWAILLGCFSFVYVKRVQEGGK
ncbi:carbohydrate ABC transporter permease [Breznakiella homolactica]|uniref:Sugar ABC transporter permease n=1 Tax=Breznakiella homolactica TaxID=2798577 RepID=A0A7T8B9G9_9SPIR|nr:sugar ABC transporter permease [Breznakiella homolactica]QQO09619.1 sugar ABC transporter permease [Breznakiella homolactica]